MNKFDIKTLQQYLIPIGIFTIVLQNAGIIPPLNTQDVSVRGTVEVEVGNKVDVIVDNTVDVEVGDMVSFNLAEVAGKKIKLTEESWNSDKWNLTGDNGILGDGASINWGSVSIQK